MDEMEEKVLAAPGELPALIAGLRRDSAEQTKLLRRQLRAARLLNVLVLLTLAALIAACVFFAPRLVRLTEKLETLASETQALVENYNAVAENIIDADLPAMVAEVNVLVAESQRAVAAARDQIEEVDITSLNEAIADLNAIIGPLAKLFGGR